TLMHPRFGFLLSVFSVSSVVFSSSAHADSPINYTRDIKPILSARCYTCHGPDEGKRKAKMRLDLRDEAIKKAIKPGDAKGSELISRVTSTEPTEVMPPPTSKMPQLTPKEIELMRQWIDQGAKFDTHWAYVKPVRPPLPVVKDRNCARNAIDYFV